MLIKCIDACESAWSELTGMAGPTQPALWTAADSRSHADSPVPTALGTDRCTGDKPERGAFSACQEADVSLAGTTKFGQVKGLVHI